MARVAARLVHEGNDAEVDVFDAIGLDVGVSEDAQLLGRAVRVVDDVPAKSIDVVTTVFGFGEDGGLFLEGGSGFGAEAVILDNHLLRVNGSGRG